MNTERVKRIATETGVSYADVQAVLQAQLQYPNGTVARWGPTGNMVIKAPDGWLRIPNTTFHTEQGIVPIRDLKDWTIVYNPDTFEGGETFFVGGVDGR